MFTNVTDAQEVQARVRTKAEVKIEPEERQMMPSHAAGLVSKNSVIPFNESPEFFQDI